MHTLASGSTGKQCKEGAKTSGGSLDVAEKQEEGILAPRHHESPPDVDLVCKTLKTATGNNC